MYIGDINTDLSALVEPSKSIVRRGYYSSMIRKQILRVLSDALNEGRLEIIPWMKTSIAKLVTEAV